MKKKSLISIILIIAMIFMQFPTAVYADNGLVFTDMPNDWSTVAIEHAIENGLLKGDNGKIMAQDNLTRAQLASVIVQAFGATQEASLLAYSDVSNTAWYYGAMAAAVQMQVFEGSNGKLYPNKNITREEAFAVLARAFKLSGGSINALDIFSDKDTISKWAVEAVASLVSEGYVSGTDGKINPKNNITRAEFAQIMYHIAQNYITKEGTYTSNFTENVIINVANVTLKNLTIKGDLIIGDGVGDGDIILDGVTVTGRIVIRGGGMNSIKIIGKSNIQNIIIARVDGKVRVYLEYGVEIGEIFVDGSDDVIIEGILGNVTIIAPNVTVTAMNATIESARVEGDNSRFIFDTNSSANNVLLSARNTFVEVNGTVTNISTAIEASNSSILANQGARINQIVINGTNTTVDGTGNVGSVSANANNTDVRTPNTKVIAGTDTSGVTAGGVGISSGTSATINRTGNGIEEDSDYSIKLIGLSILDPTLTTSKLYDRSNLAEVKTGTLQGVVAGDNVIVSAVATYDNGFVGKDKTITVVYSISGVNASKYSKPANHVVKTGEIKAVQLTISSPTMTTSKVYDGGNGAVVTAGKLSGVAVGDDITVSATAKYDSNKIGSNKTITVEYSIGGEDASNYLKPVDYVVNTGEIVEVQLTVSTPTITTSKVYDGGTLAVVTAGTLSGVVGGEDVTVIAIASYDNEIIGASKTITVRYTLGGLDAKNYMKPENDTTSNGEIKGLQLTITDPTITTSKMYDGTNAAVVTKGIVSGVSVDDDVVVSAIATYDNTVAGKNKTITVKYSITGADASNYMQPVDSVVNNGEIEPIQLTIAAPMLDTSKAYDGGTSAAIIAGGLTGIVSGDDVTVNAIGSYDDSEIGTGKTIIVAYSLGGEDAINYSSPEGFTVHTGEITKRQLTIEDPALTISKSYDGDTTAVVTAGDLLGVVAGNNVTVSVIAIYDSKMVGSSKTITVEYMLGGADAGNYIKPTNYKVTNGEIVSIQLTISVPTLTTSKIYDGSTSAEVITGMLSGVVAGDEVLVSINASYDNAVVGKNRTITVEYSISGMDFVNYVKPVGSVVTTGEIEAIQLTISAPTLTISKPYDGGTSAAVIAGGLTGKVSGDDVTVSAVSSYDNAEVGTGKTIIVAYSLTGEDAINYIKPENFSVHTGEITKLDQAAPIDLIGIKPTSGDNNDGKITGTTDKMEYKLSTATDWIAITDTQITNLSPGNYVVRYAATPHSNEGAEAVVVIQEYVESLTSKSIYNLDFATKMVNVQVNLMTKEIKDSDFSGSKSKEFTLTDQNGNTILVDLWWNIPLNEYATTPALAVGSAIESYIQQWFYDNKGGVDGLMNRTMAAYGVGKQVKVTTFLSGPGASIQVGGQDWEFFFESNAKVIGVEESKASNKTFTISDGVNTATILFDIKYNNINELVAAINLQIGMTAVNASVQVEGTNKMVIIGNNLIIGGINKALFFTTFETV